MKIINILLFLIIPLFANEYKNFNKALDLAKKENKLVYVLITSKTCHWCRKFENYTLSDKYIDKKLKQKFIVVHLSKGIDNIPLKFKTSPVPRHYFTDSYGSILYLAVGYRDVEVFDSFLRNAQENLKK